jgi:hypothetical protein
MKELSHVASSGNFLPVRMSLDKDGFVQNEWPMEERSTLAAANKAADAVNGSCVRKTDRDVVKIYDDQGKWVGGWTCQEEALAA